MKIKAIILCAVVILTVTILPVNAIEMPYDGYTYNFWGESVPAPSGVLPDSIYLGEDLSGEPIQCGEDLFVFDGLLYLLDSKKNEILVIDKDMKVVRSINKFYDNGKEYQMNVPKGLFVTKDMIFIADSGNNIAFACDYDGNILYKYERPVTEVIEKSIPFSPSKVFIDKSGIVYLVCTGVYQGFVSYSLNGEFKGFFGSNKVQMSFEMINALVFKKIFNKDTAKNLRRFLPVEFSNAYIDGDFIYTVTLSNTNSVDEVQKLNPAGANVLTYSSSGMAYPKNNFGDVESNYLNYMLIDSRFIDIHVDERGIIAVLDQQRGRVFQYDQDCNLISIFSGTSQQFGGNGMPVAIEKFNGKYVVLDQQNGTLTFFRETEYMGLVRSGINYFRNGLFKESRDLWKKVLTYNSNFTVAYQSIGKAYLQENEYEKAMEYFKLGQDRNGYSVAFREYRSQFMRKNFVLLLIIAVAVIFVFVKALGFIQKKLGIKKEKKKIIVH